MNSITSITALLITLSTSQFSLALISGGEGSEPMENNQSWPAGSEEVANLGTRIAWWEGPPFGGGEYTFEYRSESTADFNEALEAFARIAAPAKELVVQSGPKESFWLGARARENGSTAPRIDWTFTVWNPETWKSLYNDPDSTFLSDHPNFRKPVDPPRIVLYLGGGSVVWDDVEVPGGITVVDRRGEEGNGPSVRGLVSDITSGEPIAGVRVTLQPGTQDAEGTLPVATTGDDGRYHLSGIPEGGYYVVASKEGYATKRSLTFAEILGDDVRVENFPLSVAAKLSGVIRGPDRQALAGARVIATNVVGTDGFGYTSEGKVETRSGADGRFEMTGLPHGQCRLLVWIDGYYNPASVKASYPIPGPEPLAIDMVGTGTVRGTLVRTGDGQRNVRIHPPGGSVVGSWGGGMNCKEDGSFEFENVPAGEYLLGPGGVDDMEEGDPGVVKVTVEAGGLVEVLLGD